MTAWMFVGIVVGDFVGSVWSGVVRLVVGDFVRIAREFVGVVVGILVLRI